MYITDEQAAARLQNSGVVRDRILNRKERRDRVPDEQREVLGVLTALDTQSNIAKEFGTSATIVGTSARGLIDSHLDPELAKRVEEGKKATVAEVNDKVLDNLAKALVAVGNGVENLRADKAATIAVQMHSIMHNATGPQGNGRVAIIIQAPAMKERSAYPTLEVVAEK